MASPYSPRPPGHLPRRQLWIKTRCPDKWLLIDMETGEQYKGRTTEGTQAWEKIDAIEWKRVDY